MFSPFQSVLRAVLDHTASRSVCVRMEGSVRGRQDSVCVDQAGLDRTVRKVRAEMNTSLLQKINTDEDNYYICDI